MKKVLVLSALLGLAFALAPRASAQEWSWEWAQLQSPWTHADSLIDGVREMVTFTGDDVPAIIVYSDSDYGHFTLLRDIDPDPDVTVYSASQYPYAFSSFDYTRHFRADGTFLRSSHAESIHADAVTLRSSLLNPVAPDPAWSEDTTLAHVVEGPIESYTLGDFDGDGLLDWAVQRYTDLPEIVVLLNNGGTWTMVADTLDPGYDLFYFGGLYAVDIDGDGLDELFSFAMSQGVGGNQFYQNSCYTSFNADSLTARTLGDYTHYTTFFTGDMDHDGTAEVLAKKPNNALYDGDLDLGANPVDFTPRRAWSPVPIDVPFYLDESLSPSRFIAGQTVRSVGHPAGMSDFYAQRYHTWFPDSASDAWVAEGGSIDAGSGIMIELDFPRTHGRWRGFAVADAYWEYPTENHYFAITCFLPPDPPDLTTWVRLPEFDVFTSQTDVPAPIIGYGALESAGGFDQIRVVSNTANRSIQKWRVVDGEWTEVEHWAYPEEVPDNPSGRGLVADLDGNRTADVLLANGYALICLRGADGEVSWTWSQPFMGFDPVPPDDLPRAVLDADGDGLLDLYYSDGSILLNRSSNAVEPSTPGDLPSRFRIADAYPNPFNPSTTITLEVPRTGRLRVEVADLLGRRVAMLRDGVASAGERRLTFHGAGLASGVYLVRASFEGGAVQTRKLVLVK